MHEGEAPAARIIEDIGGHQSQALGGLGWIFSLRAQSSLCVGSPSGEAIRGVASGDRVAEAVSRRSDQAFWTTLRQGVRQDNWSDGRF